MGMFKRRRWDAKTQGPLSGAAVLRLHGGDPAKYRVETYAYEPGDTVEGFSRRSTCYVVDGSFGLEVGSMTALFSAGDIFEYPGGDYVLRVHARYRAVVIWAWELSGLLPLEP